MEKNDGDSYSHVLKYTGIFGGVQGLNIVIGLVRTKVVAWLLGPVGMGLSALFNSVVAFISQTTNLGISFSAVRHISELYDAGDEEQIARYVGVVRAWSLLTALFGMLVCMLAGPFLSSSTFRWGDHTLHFVLLAPAVGLMAVTGGETAILKGMRRLRSLAVIQLSAVFLALLISIPIYYFFGEAGIVPVIVLMALALMLITIRHSYRLFPLRLRDTRALLGEGMAMVRLGIAFALAGIMGSGAEMLIRSYLNVAGDLDVVGLYNAGILLTVTYAGMVFSAMETDYFPRLSAAAGDGVRLSEVVNRQIEVSVLLVAPMLSVLMVLLPLLVPLLFRGDFMPMVPMAQVMVLSMYLKSVSLPISYTVLAKGHSLSFFVIEALNAAVMVGLSVVGYQQWGLFGTGVALDLAYLFELLVAFGYARRRYGYRMSVGVVKIVCLQVPLGFAVYALTLADSSLLPCLLSAALCLASLLLSLYVLHSKSALWAKLSETVKSRFSGRG